MLYLFAHLRDGCGRIGANIGTGTAEKVVAGAEDKGLDGNKCSNSSCKKFLNPSCFRVHDDINLTDDNFQGPLSRTGSVFKIMMMNIINLE